MGKGMNELRSEEQRGRGGRNQTGGREREREKEGGGDLESPGGDGDCFLAC